MRTRRFFNYVALFAAPFIAFALLASSASSTVVHKRRCLIPVRLMIKKSSSSLVIIGSLVFAFLLALRGTGLPIASGDTPSSQGAPSTAGTSYLPLVMKQYPPPSATPTQTPTPGKSVKETFERLPTGTCSSLAQYHYGWSSYAIFQSDWVWEFMGQYQWGVGQAICEIREKDNNKYLHLEVYSARSLGAGEVGLAGWFSNPTTGFQSVKITPVHLLEFDVNWQPSPYYPNISPARINPGNFWFSYCSFPFDGGASGVGHFRGDLSTGCGEYVDGITIHVDYPSLSLPTSGRAILELDNIEVTPNGPFSATILNSQDSVVSGTPIPQNAIQLHRR